MTVKLRHPAGAIVLFASVCFLTPSTGLTADLSKDTVKKANAADVAALQKYVDDIAAEPAKNKKFIPGAKALAAILVLRGEGDAGKVGQALEKKDHKGAVAAAKGLGQGGKAVNFEYDLNDAMAPFRLTRSGGLNLEKDMKDGAKAGKIDPAAAELIGARTAPLGELTAKLANDKAKTNPSTTAKWEKWSQDMVNASKELAAEGAKGAGADQKKLTTILKKLDASCSNCHNDFRD